MVACGAVATRRRQCSCDTAAPGRGSELKWSARTAPPGGRRTGAAGRSRFPLPDGPGMRSASVRFRMTRTVMLGFRPVVRTPDGCVTPDEAVEGPALCAPRSATARRRHASATPHASPRAADEATPGKLRAVTRWSPFTWSSDGGSAGGWVTVRSSCRHRPRSTSGRVIRCPHALQVSTRAEDGPPAGSAIGCGVIGGLHGRADMPHRDPRPSGLRGTVNRPMRPMRLLTPRAGAFLDERQAQVRASLDHLRVADEGRDGPMRGVVRWVRLILGPTLSTHSTASLSAPDASPWTTTTRCSRATSSSAAHSVARSSQDLEPVIKILTVSCCPTRPPLRCTDRCASLAVATTE
jgi:hypothetical protein